MEKDINFEFSLDELTEEIEDFGQKTEFEQIKITNQHLFHRLNSERHLEETLPLEIEIGASYHCISGGDIDSLSYLMWITRMQKIKKLLISTWCIAKTDIEELKRQVKIGKIETIDFYVGEILPGSYKNEYKMICEFCKEIGSRVVVFRNHSKVIAGHGEKFDFAIESSANVNTNPRTEQTTITFLKQLADFYFNFYGKIVSFDKEWR